MKQARAQKKAKLQTAAERLIEQLLDWDEQSQQPNLSQIEDDLLKSREQFGQEMAEVVTGGQEATQPVANPVCAQCGQPVRY